jgi:hypothetical protein
MPETAVALAANPLISLHYTYGMLLGKDDFVTEQAYHRGKAWLHNAWLHREGVVWGLGVEAVLERDEIVVHAGFALAPNGEEMIVASDACVNVPAWLEKHRTDPGLVIATDPDSPGAEIFEAHIVLAPAACLARPVPSIAETCGDTSGAPGVAYSRVMETVEIALVPGPAPARTAAPYHRLRLLFGLDEPQLDPADQEVLTARSQIAALPAAERPTAFLDAFRRFAALDAAGLGAFQDPSTGEASLFPAAPGTGIVLASITGVTVLNGSMTAATVDFTGRASLVATQAIQELLCGPSTADGASGAGPQVLPESVAIVNDNTIQFTLDSDAAPLTVSTLAISVSAIAGGGWELLTVAPFYDPATRIATLTVNPPMAADALVRLRILGTGPAPLVGVNGVPFAGSSLAPSGSAVDGSDFVWMQKRGA